MKYILATDSFKGCMSSQEVEDEIAEVLNAKGIETVCLPMSDGGDGMLSAFTTATGGTLEPVYIHDLMMRRTDAHYGVTPDGTAIVEVAQACGLSLIKEEERNPMRATTYGVGELLSRAIKRGCRKFVIGLGGTATSDVTAPMFCISGTELIPMPMAHTPNTLLSSVVKRVESFLLNTVPRTPPSATVSTLTITPIILSFLLTRKHKKPPNRASPVRRRS